MINGVSWKDYEGVEGFYGSSSPSEVQALNKALSAGADINAPGSAVAGDGFALRVESLESTLKSTTFRAEHVRLWRALPKLPAYNTIEEYNQIQSYGQIGNGAFIGEGALPSETDSTYQRKYSQVKFLGTTRRVTHQMALVRPGHGNVIAQETVNGTMYLLRQIEEALFSGDSSIDPIQWDGFDKLIVDGAPASNIIDLRGQPLTEDVLVDASLTVMDAPNYGQPTHLYLNPKVKADLVKTFFAKGRYNVGSPNLGTIGGDVTSFTSPAGEVKLEQDVFISDGGGVTGLVAVGSASARPASPTITTAAAAAPNAASQFAASDAGNYFYWVVACNQYGESAPVAVNAVTLAVAAGDQVTFGVTPGAGPLPTFYKVYRTLAGGATGTARFMVRVANSGGAGATTVTDRNARIPGCTSGYLFQQNIENMAFKQLAPMVKIPLATIDPSIRWMQLLYGVPQLYTPAHNVIFRNIGRSPGYVGAP